MLNINEIPKPITYRVIDVKSATEDNKKSQKKSMKTNANETEATNADKDKEVMEVTPEEVTSTPTSISTLINANNNKSNRYGVKVLIVSLPTMSDIYDRVFGSDFDAISSGR